MSRGTEVIAVIAQQPFYIGEFPFATVKPIAIIEEDRLEHARDGDYPNRNLCWWMVRGISPMRELIPGRLIVGNLEDADRYDPQDPDKDKFQIAWDSVKLGGPKNIIEVIDAPPGIVARDLINRPGLLNLDHVPTSMVMVHLGDKVFGPFKANYDPCDQEFLITLERPQSNELTSVLEWQKVRDDAGFIRVNRVALSRNDMPTNKSSELFFPTFQVLHWNRFETLQADSVERVRLLSDKEIVRHAAKKVLSGKRLRDFMQQWDDIRKVYLAPELAQEEPDVYKVFSALDACLRKERDSVDEIIQHVVNSDVLADRLKQAIDHATQIHIESHSTALDAKIAETVTAKQQQAEQLEKEIQQLKNELDRKRRQEEAAIQAELSQKREEFNEWVETQRIDIERQRSEINNQRVQLEQSLNEAVTRFTEGRDALVADFLSLSPFLRQLGAIGSSTEESMPIAKTREAREGLRATLDVPDFLDNKVGNEGLIDETVFFERFTRHVEQAGFRFKRQDLLAFHLSVKCGDLTILGGLSGTGKSSLPVLYTQALSGNLHRFLRVDVSPAWLEPGDLLGRANLLEQRFQPAPTGLYERLVWAAMELRRIREDSHLWIVCLDEMNLAQPEHYFSGFIQALPHDSSQRTIGVFSDTSVHSEDPWRAWHRIPLGSNLRFIGTVNYDETTKPLSQRLLDRSNQIYVESVPFGNLQRRPTTDVMAPEGPPVTVASFASWTRDAPLTGKAATLIDELQEPLAVLGCPLNPRSYEAIKRFVASSKGLCSPEEAFDMQLCQRILSQIRGLFRPEARKALQNVRRLLANQESTFSGATRMLERIAAENAMEIDFESIGGML